MKISYDGGTVDWDIEAIVDSPKESIGIVDENLVETLDSLKVCR